MIGKLIFFICECVFCLCLVFTFMSFFSGPFFVLISGFMTYLSYVIFRYADAAYMD